MKSAKSDVGLIAMVLQFKGCIDGWVIVLYLDRICNIPVWVSLWVDGTRHAGNEDHERWGIRRLLIVAKWGSM